MSPTKGAVADQPSLSLRDAITAMLWATVFELIIGHAAISNCFGIDDRFLFHIKYDVGSDDLAPPRPHEQEFFVYPLYLRQPEKVGELDLNQVIFLGVDVHRCLRSSGTLGYKEIALVGGIHSARRFVRRDHGYHKVLFPRVDFVKTVDVAWL